MLRRAVELRPNDGYIVDSLGWAHFKLGQYPEATQTLERAVDLKPADPVLNDHLGDAYWRVNRKVEARFQWNHARDMNPEPEDLPAILKKIEFGLPDPGPNGSAPQEPSTDEGERRLGRASVPMRWYRAPAKLNLTLKVVGRRLDGFHDIESLTAFAGESDWLGLSPGRRFELVVEGPAAQDTGPLEDNLVARAARAFAARIPEALTGRFHLIKRLPAAAGLGGGSSDAAACIRALAEANGVSLSDERVQAAALETGSDVAVCVSACARVMSGVGDRLGDAGRTAVAFCGARQSAPGSRDTGRFRRARAGARLLFRYARTPAARARSCIVRDARNARLRRQRLGNCRLGRFCLRSSMCSRR